MYVSAQREKKLYKYKLQIMIIIVINSKRSFNITKQKLAEFIEKNNIDITDFHKLHSCYLVLLSLIIFVQDHLYLFRISKMH